MNPYERSAQECYERYSRHCGNLNHQGLPMPTWEGLEQETREHWIYAIAPLVKPFTKKELREVYDNLLAITEDINNAIYTGENGSQTNMIEVGSELGKALVRLEFVSEITGEKLTEMQKDDSV